MVVIPHVRKREGDFENSRKDSGNDDHTFGPKISMGDVNATGVEEQILEKWRIKIRALAALELFVENVHGQQQLSMKKWYTAKCAYAVYQDV